jgi:hypothetical protein
MVNREKLKEFVLDWNVKFPIDHWWREKHKVAFLSTFHKESNFLYQLAEWEEETLFSELRDSKDEYKPNTGNFLKPQFNLKDVSEEDFISYAKEELKNFGKK